MKRQQIDIDHAAQPSRIMLALQCIGLALSITLIHRISDQDYLGASLRDSGHALVFFQFTYLLLSARQRWRPCSTGAVMGIVALSLACGIVIEIVQPFVGRHASLLDAFYDLLGCLAAGLWFCRKRLTRPWPAHVGAALLLAISLIQPTIYFLEHQRREARLPDLVDWSAPLHRLYWWANPGTQISIVQPSADSPRVVARIDMLSGKYPGIVLRHLHSNWRDFSTLELNIRRKDPAPLPLGVRIHDHRHIGRYQDRYNQRFILRQGDNRIRIGLDAVRTAPASREMAMTSIDEIILFIDAPQTAQSMYLGQVRLIR